MKHQQDEDHRMICLLKLLRVGQCAAKLAFLTLILLFLLAAQDVAAATAPSPGDLDTSFSGDGELLTDFQSRQDLARGIAIQPDRKIVVAGQSGGNIALARYLPNGEPDIGFGTDGKVLTNFGMTVKGLALQPDGKIVIAGNNNADISLARYLPNGEPDVTFNGNGTVLTDLGGTEIINAMVINYPAASCGVSKTHHANDSHSVTPECFSPGSRSGLAWIPA